VNDDCEFHEITQWLTVPYSKFRRGW